MPSINSFREQFDAYAKLCAVMRVVLAALLLNLANAATIDVEPPIPTSTRANLKKTLEQKTPPRAIEPPLPSEFPEQKKVVEKAPKKRKKIPKSRIVKIVREEARAAGLDPRYVLAVAKIESSLNPHAVSKKGAIGVMQLMPKTAEELGVEDPFNARQNIRGGIAHLSELIEKYGEEHALVAYLHGENALKKFLKKGEFPESATEYLAKFRKLQAAR